VPADRRSPDPAASLPPHTRLGPYEILEAIGAGGMSEVYRVRDTRLDCLVALKVLPARIAGNSNACARFDQLRGLILDSRTDVFSFGLVVHQMATGRRAFGGTGHFGAAAFSSFRFPIFAN
jgi:serine/threonine protein kinase